MHADRAEAQDVVAENRPGAVRSGHPAGSAWSPSRTAFRTVRAAASPIPNVASASDAHATQACTSWRDDLADHANQRREHRGGDEPVHRPGSRGDPPVISGDRVADFDREVSRAMAPHLDVEHQVEPQHREEEADADRRERVHRCLPERSIVRVVAQADDDLAVRVHERVDIGGRQRPSPEACLRSPCVRAVPAEPGCRIVRDAPSRGHATARARTVRGGPRARTLRARSSLRDEADGSWATTTTAASTTRAAGPAGSAPIRETRTSPG